MKIVSSWPRLAVSVTILVALGYVFGVAYLALGALAIAAISFWWACLGAIGEVCTPTEIVVLLGGVVVGVILAGWNLSLMIFLGVSALAGACGLFLLLWGGLIAPLLTKYFPDQEA